VKTNSTVLIHFGDATHAYSCKEETYHLQSQ